MTTVTVIGAGLMGAGIAQVAAATTTWCWWMPARTRSRGRSPVSSARTEKFVEKVG